jgi:serine/threonine protein kinase
MEETFEIDVVAQDGVWPVTFSRRSGPASWADAAFVWVAIAAHPDGRRHASLWAISGLVLARLGSVAPNEEALAELIVAEYRRRCDEILGQPEPKVVIEQADYTRLTTPAPQPLERIGREIDGILLEMARRLPGLQRFGQEGGTEIDLELPQPEVWLLESIVLPSVDEVIANFFQTYEKTRAVRFVIPANAAGVSLELRRLIRMGGVARRRIWMPVQPAVTLPPPHPEKLEHTVPGYELGEALGEGGFGIVYRAKDAAGVERAIKLLAPIAVVEQASARERFHREAQALSRLKHPNIAQYLHLAECPSGWYLVMELIRGANLHHWSREQPYDERIRAIADALDGLQHMHEHDVIHRDLKPSNIVVEDGTGRAVIVDLGLAWILQEDGSDLKTRGSTWSAAYAPPESLAAPESSRSPAHDIFSMGVVLYEVLAGNRRGRVDGVALGSLADELKAIDPVVMRATAPVASRFQSAAEFANHLRAAIAGSVSVSVQEQVTSGTPTGSEPSEPVPRIEFSETAIFFHDRFCEAFPGVRGTAHVQDAKEMISRLNVLLKEPLRATVNPIWELSGNGSMPVTRFRVVDESTVLISHHRFKMRDLFACRGHVYHHDFVVLRWDPDSPSGLYPVPSPEEIAEAVEQYGGYAEEYGVWNGELITRHEYDDNAVFRDGRSIETSSSELEVRELAPGAMILTGQSSAAHNRGFDRQRVELLRELAADRVTIDRLVAVIDELEPVEPRDRR